MDTLNDIEALPLADRIRSIETLAAKSLPSYTDVQRIIEKRATNSILTVTVSRDRQRFMTAALLTMLVADQALIPERSARNEQLQPFYELCHHFDIDVRDIVDLSQYASQIEAALMARWSADNHE